MMRARFAAFAFAMAASLPAVARADDDPNERGPEPASAAPIPRRAVPAPPEPVAPGPRAQADAQIEERLGFLEERIATQHLHARLWWESWVSFYGIGVIVQSARAIEADEDAERADLIVSAVKAAGGVVRYVVDPMKGIQGFGEIPGESRAARLARGEKILAENAEATTPFGPWYAHLINAAINGAGAVIVGAAFDDWERGLISAGIGFAVGEVSLLTQPWEADADLEEYESRFGKGRAAARAPKVEWSIVPIGAGAGVHARF